jgi:hypothetical protein
MGVFLWNPNLGCVGTALQLTLERLVAVDIDVYLLESVVFVHDRGDWVADLNSLWNYSCSKYHANPPCRHEDKDQHSSSLVSINIWAELLDRQGSHAVVRAHKNWQGRFAAASISLVKGYSTIILPSNKTCWKCLSKLYAKSVPIVVVD